MKYVTFDGVTSQTNSQTLGDSAVAQVAQVASVQPVEIKAAETVVENPAETDLSALLQGLGA
jgi:hypothetical protein